MANPEEHRDALEKFIAWQEGDEWRAHCPMPDHEDNEPSAYFNFKKGVWICHGCGEEGTIRTLVKRLKSWSSGTKKKQNRGGLEERRESSSDLPGPSPQQVQGYVRELYERPGLMNYLIHDRGLDVGTLEEYSVGWSESRGRYTIPVYDEDGNLVNIRFYKPDPGPKEAKMMNLKGHGRRRIFGEKMLPKVDKVILTEGEWDAMIARQYRGHEPFAAVSSTSGAKNFDPGWARLFKDKRVFVLYDCDEEGRAGAKKAAEIISNAADSVFIVDLGLEKGEDVTDYFVKYGHSGDDFKELLDSARRYVSSDSDEAHRISGDAIRVPFRATYDAKYSGQPLEVIGTVVGKKGPPYQPPSEVLATCEMSWSEKACPMCPMSARQGESTIILEPNDERVLRFMDAQHTKEETILKDMVGIPPRCPQVKFQRILGQNIERLIVGPSIDDPDSDGEVDSRIVYSVGKPGIETNKTVKMVGTNTPDPRNQLNAFMAWNVRETESSLDTFEVNEENVRLMKKFQCGPGQDPLGKMREIAHDVSENVTHIYGREDLQISTDLVMHSVLGIPLRGRKMRGWLDFLVIGDTRTGKSELVTKTLRHYAAGTIANCETATMAGLLGAVKQHGNDWSLEWGLIPLNDRRAVLLDEASGLRRGKENIISQLSGVRSSGVAEIHKVESGRTLARTRLIWISNPIKGENLGNSLYGVQEVQRLIDHNEDVARFDFAMACTLDDVEFEEIRRADRPAVDHTYTSDACHALVMWAWSRKANQVKWMEGAEESVFAGAAWLGERYINDPPLLQQTNAHEKVARLAVAVAARVFSADETNEKVLVGKEHVRAAVNFLHEIYKSPAFGYYDLSQRMIAQEEQSLKAVDEVWKYLRQQPALGKFLIRCAQTTGRFRSEDLQDYLGYGRDETNIAINRLYDAFMIEKEASTAYILPRLNRLLKEME